MAITVKFKLGSSTSSNTVVFAETSTGHFTTAITSTDTTSVTSSGTSLRAAAVSTVAGYYVYNWWTPTGTKSSDLVTWTSSPGGSASYPMSAYTTTTGPKVTVVDEHGTHLGTPTGTGCYGTGHCVGVKHDTTDDGYTFTGWTVTAYAATQSTAYGTMLSTGYSKNGNVYTFDETDEAVVFQVGTGSSYAVTFTANYEQSVSTFTLTYDANGGSTTPSSQSAESGSVITLAAAIKQSGYTFAGWKIGSTVYAAGSSYTITSDVTATAQWTKNVATCSVSFNKDSSDVSGDELPTLAVTSGNSVVLPAPTLWVRDGYAFVGWSTSSGSASAAYSAGDAVVIKKNTTFYAVWGATSGTGGKANTYAYSLKAGVRLVTERYTKDYTFAVYTNVTSASVAMKYDTRLFGAMKEVTSNYSPSYTTNPQTRTTSSRSQTDTQTSTMLASTEGVSLAIPSDYLSYSSYSDTDTSGTTRTVVSKSISTTIDSDWKWTAPELDGYEFIGWYTIGDCYESPKYIQDSDFTVKVGEALEINFKELVGKLNYLFSTFRQYTDSNNYTESASYTNCVQLRYLGVKVLVLFDATGGDLDDFYREVRYDQAYGDLPTPTWSGHTFLGWFTAVTDGTQVKADTLVTNKEEHILYAHWEDDGSSGGETGMNYTITFNANGGMCATTSKTATSGSAVGTLPAPTKSGFVFDGWRDAGGMQYTAVSVMPASNLTLTASWTSAPITIAFDANGGTCSTTSRQILPGEVIGSLPTATKTGASHAGWFTAASGGTKVLSSTTFSSSTTIYAKWGAASAPLVIVKYPITFVLNGGTLDAAYICKYTMGVAKTLPTASQVAKSGATFAGWFESTDLSGSAVTQIPSTATGAKTFYAKWE